MGYKKTACMISALFVFLTIFAERYIVEFPAGIPVEAKGLIHRFEHLNMITVSGTEEEIRSAYPDAVYIHRDLKVKAAYEPDDQYFPYQWNLAENHYNMSYLLDSGVTGSKTVVMGILDTGIAYKDADIPFSEGLLVESTDGYFHKYPDFSDISFVKAYDFVSDDTSACDMNGHGTAVCAIIASDVNNGMYLSGIVSNASIMPLRVLDENGEGYVSDIVSGIQYALDHGVRVLNLSLAGTPGDSAGWHPLHSAIIDARNRGVLTVCATGNDGVDEISYPAAFDEAIAVGAVDYFSDLADYSQYGENMDFVAPGGKVYQDINGDGEYDGGIVCPGFENIDDQADVSNFTFYYMEGTSFACPHITALIGLAYSMGYNDPDEIENLLIESSLDLGASGYDYSYGWGYPLPESLFNEPISSKVIGYEHSSGSFTAYARGLNSAAIDSLIIQSRFTDTIFRYASADEIMEDMHSLNTGFYSLYFYYSSPDDTGFVKRDIVIKSPLDNSDKVYAGNTEIVFASSSLLEMNERSLKISDEYSGPVRILFNDNTGIIKSSSGSVSFDGKYYVLQGSGYYYFSNTGESRDVEPASTHFVSGMIQLEGPYTLIDKCGRIIEKGEGLLNMSQKPSGLYILKTGEINCRLIKLQ